MFSWFSLLCCGVGEWEKKFDECNGMVKPPIFQGKKKKRKREKLQESASGRPWTTFTYRWLQVYSRNQGLRYLICTCFSLTLDSARCSKILRFAFSQACILTVLVSFPLHLSILTASTPLAELARCCNHPPALPLLFSWTDVCVVLKLNYDSNTVWDYWMLETLHWPFCIHPIFYRCVSRFCVH